MSTDKELAQKARHGSFVVYSFWGGIIAAVAVSMLLVVRYTIDHSHVARENRIQRKTYEDALPAFNEAREAQKKEIAQRGQEDAKYVKLHADYATLQDKRHFEEALAGMLPLESIKNIEFREALRVLREIPIDKNEEAAVVQVKAWLYDTLVMKQVPAALKPFVDCQAPVCTLDPKIITLQDVVRFVRIRSGDVRTMTGVPDVEPQPPTHEELSELVPPTEPEEMSTPFPHIGFIEAAVGYGTYALVFAFVFYLVGWIKDGAPREKWSQTPYYTSPRSAWPASLFGFALMLTALPGLILMRLISADMRGFFAWFQSKFDGIRKTNGPFDDLLQRLDNIRENEGIPQEMQERARSLRVKLELIKKQHEELPLNEQLAEIQEFVGLEGDRAQETDKQLKST